MDTEDNDMGFQHTGGVNILNCPSSGMNTNPMSNKVAEMAMSSGCMFKSSNGADPFLGSGWDPLVSLSQSENFGGSSMVPHSEFANNPPYPVGGSSMVHYPSDSGLVELVPKLPCFGSGRFSELVGSLGLPECPPNYSPNKEGGIEKTSRDGAHSQEDYQIPDEGASPNGKRKKTALESQSPFNPNKNFEGEQPKDLSGDSAEFPEEQDEKKQKIEQNLSANLGVKQKSKLGKDNSNNGENYIHVRARRGQATNSHSLAERVRRERISERMRLLQELVPGCNKITGKAVMLDEIINYVQSLQQQVEFLSMKLATVNPELNVDIEQILSKDILHSRSGSAPILGYGSGMSSSHPYPQGIYPGITSTNPPFHPMPQNVWENELQSLLQMGFDSNLAINNLGPNGRSK